MKTFSDYHGTFYLYGFLCKHFTLWLLILPRMATVLIYLVHLVPSTLSLPTQNSHPESLPGSATQWHSTKLSGNNAWIIISQNTREYWSWAPLAQCKLRLFPMMFDAARKTVSSFHTDSFSSVLCSVFSASLASDSSQQHTSLASRLGHSCGSHLAEFLGAQCKKLQAKGRKKESRSQKIVCLFQPWESHLPYL